jgi:O-acetyl-ADP-ribose deacetylase (regulator of RNase III)
VRDAAVQAVAGLRAAEVEHVTEVLFVLRGEEALAAFETALTG